MAQGRTEAAACVCDGCALRVSFLNPFVLRLSWAALIFGRLNNALEKDMKFQDEGGLLLPPSIEQKVSSTGISTGESR